VVKGQGWVCRHCGQEVGCVIWRDFRGGIPVSAHRLIAGLVQKAPVAILSAELCIASRRFSWEGGASP